MEKQGNALLNNTMIYGGILGVVFIVFNIVRYIIFSTPVVDGVGLLGLGVQVAMILFFGKKFRKEFLSDQMSYGQAFKYGFLFSFFATVILSLYAYIYYAVINTSGIDQLILETERNLEQVGWFSDEMVTSILDAMEETTTTLSLSLRTIFSGALIGLIISLIVAIFLKTSDNPFAGQEE